MATDEKIDRLTSIVEALAETVVAHETTIAAHDNQIGALITVAEKQSAAIASTQKAIESLERQWQAYINRLPRK